MRTMLEAVRWDGSNVAEIEAFVGRSPKVVDDILEVTEPQRGDTVTVGVGGWLVRVDGALRALASTAPPPEHADEPPAERVEAVTETLAFESGYD